MKLLSSLFMTSNTMEDWEIGSRSTVSVAYISRLWPELPTFATNQRSECWSASAKARRKSGERWFPWMFTRVSPFSLMNLGLSWRSLNRWMCWRMSDLMLSNCRKSARTKLWPIPPLFSILPLDFPSQGQHCTCHRCYYQSLSCSRLGVPIRMQRGVMGDLRAVTWHIGEKQFCCRKQHDNIRKSVPSMDRWWSQSVDLGNSNVGSG